MTKTLDKINCQPKTFRDHYMINSLVIASLKRWGRNNPVFDINDEVKRLENEVSVELFNA